MVAFVLYQKCTSFSSNKGFPLGFRVILVPILPGSTGLEVLCNSRCVRRLSFVTPNSLTPVQTSHVWAVEVTKW